jgi:hypothetical protein
LNEVSAYRGIEEGLLNEIETNNLNEMFDLVISNSIQY